MPKDLNLDVSKPEDVASVLNEAADSYRQSASELEAAWQDKNAGRPWEVIADVLENASIRIGKALKRIRY